MTDLAAEAALVAEALGCDKAEPDDLCMNCAFYTRGIYAGQLPIRIAGLWPRLVSLALRLREAEQERDRWRDLALQHAPAVTADQVVGGYGVATDAEWAEPEGAF
jgi:hypothetical protein